MSTGIRHRDRDTRRNDATTQGTSTHCLFIDAVTLANSCRPRCGPLGSQTKMHCGQELPTSLAVLEQDRNALVVVHDDILKADVLST